MNSRQNKRRTRGGIKLLPKSVLRSSDDDKALFLKIDLPLTTSVAVHLPIRKGCGTAGMVPKHIRAADKNPRKVLLGIEYFRRMSALEQKQHVDLWRDLSFSQKKEYSDNLSYLVSLKEKLLLDQVKWEDVAPDPTNELPEPPRPAKKVRKTAPVASSSAQDSEGLWIKEWRARLEEEEEAASAVLINLSNQWTHPVSQTCQKMILVSLTCTSESVS